MTFTASFLAEFGQLVGRLDEGQIENCVELVARTREVGGRLFVLGVGGSAANASHAVNDFRKLAGVEAYAPTDNVAELTARTNDDGWPSVFANWLRISHLGPNDLVMVLSVGGGDREKNISGNLVAAIDYACEVGTPVIGIVGRDGGYTAKMATACVVVPTVNAAHVTPHSESTQALIWHLLVFHPRLKASPSKWESIT